MNLVTEISLAWYSKLQMPGGIMVILWPLFLIKHLVVDFFLQGPYQYKNKGSYGHPGGLLHSGLHGLTTLALLLVFSASVLPVVVSLSVFDFITHYHIDWAKVQITKRKGWGPTTHEEFWWLLGVDQFAHMAVYWLIITSAM